MKILVTGANGFIGKNLIVSLSVYPDIDITKFSRGDDERSLSKLISQTDVIIHLAAENRPADKLAFEEVNVGLTKLICCAVLEEFQNTSRSIPIIFTSSKQAVMDNAYGLSKKSAEGLLEKLSASTGNSCAVFRLPGVFGKWCKPNYNSVVATFCHNIAHNLDITISDSSKVIELAYIDDVVKAIIADIFSPVSGFARRDVLRTYTTTLHDLADKIYSFKESRNDLVVQRVGTGLDRALYSTFLSYLPVDNFKYELREKCDDRGKFVEVLKTKDSGQVSFFTAKPGITRGGHYHNTKTEKFLIVQGTARFRFFHLLTGELIEMVVSSDKAEIVDTIPGWVHDVTNIGERELIVMLWANEIFDELQPDTVMCEMQCL